MSHRLPGFTLSLYASLSPTQIPAIMNHASFLDPCTSGVGYALLIIVPSFYLLSAVLFAVLGAVTVCWDRVTATKDFSYEKVDDSSKEFPPVSP